MRVIAEHRIRKMSPEHRHNVREAIGRATWEAQVAAARKRGKRG